MSQYPKNTSRAARAAIAIEAYIFCESHGEIDPSTNVIDLLTDLRHYCDHHKLSLRDLDGMAQRHYLAERFDQLSS